MDITPRHLPVRFTPYKIFTASEQKGKGWTSVLTLNASRLTTPQLKGMHWKLLHSKIKKKKGFHFNKIFLGRSPRWKLAFATSNPRPTATAVSDFRLKEFLKIFHALTRILDFAHTLFSLASRPTILSTKYRQCTSFQYKNSYIPDYHII